MKQLTGVYRSSEMHWVGDGFPVRSVFSYQDMGEQLSPFLLLDYAPPTVFTGDGKRRGVGAHPHRGFETVTIVYHGGLEHRDSSGGGGQIGPGDVQWMTAGAGIIHEEFHSDNFSRIGGTLEMIQLWVNLPAKDKGAQPGYQTILKDSIPNVTLPGGGTLRVIAGDYSSYKGPAKTFTPLNLWDITISANTSFELPVPNVHVAAILVLRGNVAVQDGQKAAAGDLCVFDRQGEGVSLTTQTDASILVMSGAPIDEPITGHGPFVMNTQAEIEQAMKDYRNGAMGILKK